MALVDNRVNVDLFNGTLTTTDYLSTSSAALDTEVFYQGSASIAENMNSSLRAIVFDAGTPQNWSNNTFYVLVNCGVVGNLQSKAAGGFRIRFCGGADEGVNFFEVYVGGIDSWPASFAGGWSMFIVDVETARSTAVTNGWTNGTVPATTAIQCVGYAGITTNMLRTSDNTWLNGIWRLPSGTSGILVEGQNTGAVDWTFADVLSANDANSWGSFRRAAGGAYVCNVPILIGSGVDSLTHGFTDTNATVLWENSEYLADGFYGVTVLGGVSNTVDVVWGAKTGTGANATGAQGVTFQSDAGQSGLRWYLDVNDTFIDSFGAYGCSFVNGQIFSLDQNNVEVISSLFLNCNEATQSLGANSSLWQRNSVIDSNTLDGTAFLKSVDLDNIKYSLFEFSDGHAIEVTTLGAALTGETFLGNNFSGYNITTGSTDAAIYNNSGQSVTINVTGGNLIDTSYRNGTAASTIINNNVAITVTKMKDNTEVRVFQTSTIDIIPPYTAPTELAGIENAVAGTLNNREFTFSVASGTGITIRTFNENWIADDVAITPIASQSVQIAQRQDRVFSNL